MGGNRREDSCMDQEIIYKDLCVCVCACVCVCVCACTCMHVNVHVCDLKAVEDVTHRKLLHSPACCLGIVPELDSRDDPRLIKHHIHTVDHPWQHRSQPHMASIQCIVHTVYQFVWCPHIPPHALQHIDTGRKRSNV